MRWTKWEIEYLEKHSTDGAEKIARKLGRSVRSVQVQACRYGISLQKRYFCPNCGSYSFTPLLAKTGWCRCCSLRNSRDSAAIINRKVHKDLEEERRREQEAERQRQSIYSDTEKTRRKLRRFRELRKQNENKRGA